MRIKKEFPKIIQVKIWMLFLLIEGWASVILRTLYQWSKYAFPIV